MNYFFNSVRDIGIVLTLVATCICTSATANTFNVKPGDNLQLVINRANLGDTILLPPGSTFSGPFTLPAKSGSSYLLITTSANNSLPEQRRVSPTEAGHMAKLVAPGSNQPAAQTAPGAHHYRFVGIEFAPANAQAYVSVLVRLGDSHQDQLSSVPHDLILDRCYVHGLPGAPLKRGVELNSASTQIIQSYISDCKYIGQDSQAVCGWNGPGPFVLTNNYFEAAGENVMFGGADPAIPNLVPTNIQVTGNTFAKPLSWRVGDPSYAGNHWTVKNLFEIKNAQQVRIQGNLFENCWADAQTGSAINLKSANQDGAAPWSVCQDVTFDGNTVRHAGSGINLLGQSNNAPCRQAKGIRIVNNLFYDIDGVSWGGAGFFVQANGMDSVQVDHNTAIHSGNPLQADSVNTGFSFTNNIVMHNLYGVKGAGTGVGNATLSHYFPGCTFSRNAMVWASPRASLYPTDNYFPMSIDDVGFVNALQHLFRLADGSRYKNKATDGKDIGCISFAHTP